MKKKYLVQIDVMSGCIQSCDECLYDNNSDYINNGVYFVVVTADNPKDAQRIGQVHFKVAREIR